MIAPVIVNITVTSQWARWRLKPPASRLFTQSFIQAQIKENRGPVKFPAQMASNAGMFPFDDVIMSNEEGYG